MTPTPQQIEAAAEQYAEQQSSAYTNDCAGFIAGAEWALQQSSTNKQVTFTKPNIDNGIRELDGFLLGQLVRVVANVDYCGGTGEITIIEPETKHPFRVDFTSTEWAFYKADEITHLPEPPQK